MDWIRRNWPDLLIGLALLAVIGGIIATLLNGGNFLPGRNTPITTTTPTVSSGGNSSTEATTPTISPDLPSGTATIESDTGETTGTITPVDLSTPAEEVANTVETATENAVSAVEETIAEATTPEDTTTAAVAPNTSETAPYRISVGAFGSAENAERRAETFRSAGYPVFVAKQGDLSLVLIGPYESQAAAQQAVSQIQSSGLEANPIIYEFTPADTSSETTSTPDVATETSTETTVSETTVSETATSEAATETPTETTAVALPTSNTGRYLQVGAYGSVESAQPQLVRLQGLGFSVTYIEENAKIKLLVGPYEGATLETAKAQLQAQGIDHFVR